MTGEEESKIFLLVLFISGFTSMAYEIVLIREISIIVGPTESASALVLSAFMAGLALGAYILGNLSEKKNPIRLLITVEIILSVVGLILLPIIRSLALIKSMFLIFVLSFLMMLTPAFFMGGEIPIVSKILNRNNKTGANVGKAYASDTIGGILGSLLAGFYLLPELGSFRVFVFGSLLNAIGALLIIYRRKLV